jgi:hypothetical protein
MIIFLLQAYIDLTTVGLILFNTVCYYHRLFSMSSLNFHKIFEASQDLTLVLIH